MNVSPEFKAMLAIKFDLCKKAGLSDASALKAVREFWLKGAGVK